MKLSFFSLIVLLNCFSLVHGMDRNDKQQLGNKTVINETSVVVFTHLNDVPTACFNRDETKLITISQDRTARLWDIAIGQQLLEIPHDDLARLIRFKEDGSIEYIER